MPGEPLGRDKTVCSPFRDDKHPSFSIFARGKRWKDHGTGEQGNAADLSNGDACRELIRLAGTGFDANGGIISSDPPEQSESASWLGFREHCRWDRDMAQRVADSRGLHITAVEFAFLWLNTLSFRYFCNVECWLLGDRSSRCVEARRIDREKFPASANLSERKSHTFSGFSDKKWPVGILPPGFEDEWLQKHVRKILLVEGGPDYLAACQIIAESPATDFDNVFPVAMLGASNDIADDALHHFSERQTTIVAHGDNEGCNAAERWKGQIISVGGAAQVFYLNQEGTDLCDVVAAGATYEDIALFK